MKKDIRDLTLDELKEEIAAIGKPVHKARQIFLWLNKKNVNDLSVMTDLSKDLIAELKKKYILEKLECSEHLVSKAILPRKTSPN